jgi:hypothetical protein
MITQRRSLTNPGAVARPSSERTAFIKQMRCITMSVMGMTIDEQCQVMNCSPHNIRHNLRKGIIHLARHHSLQETGTTKVAWRYAQIFEKNLRRAYELIDDVFVISEVLWSLETHRLKKRSLKRVISDASAIAAPSTSVEKRPHHLSRLGRRSERVGSHSNENETSNVGVS